MTDNHDKSMQTNTQSTEGKDPQKTTIEASLDGAACPRCGSSRQTLTCGGNPQLYHCGSSDSWQSTDCEYRCEIDELQSLTDFYRSQRDGLAEALQGIASGRPCECVNWCRDGRDIFSPHHPRCDHYTPPPTDPRFARFGEAMWKYITKLGGDFCGEEISEDILPLAQSAGLCCRVEYDPEIHGEGIDAELGDEIWWWGDSDWMNAQADL